jgi:hypothetical protein
MDAAIATPDKIRILDLADPVLSPLQQQALMRAAQHPVCIDEETILSAARERTGLIEFGADDFRPRLRAWAHALNQDKGLSDAGRFSAWSEMVRFASTRLQVEDCVRRNPAILDIPIETSVVVAGLPIGYDLPPSAAGWRPPPTLNDTVGNSATGCRTLSEEQHRHSPRPIGS